MRLRPEALSTSPLLTTREAAAYLRIGERKLYDLVAARDVPHVRVTGKLLFPQPLLDAWLLSRAEFRDGVDTLQQPAAVIAGSHDPLLDWALREARADLPTQFDGSLDGLRRMAAGRAIAAGLHLPPQRDPTGQEVDGNRLHVGRALRGQPVVVIEWARRTQGLMLAAGNPLGIAGPADLRRRRVIPRQPEAGSYLLLLRLLEQAGLDPDAVDWLPDPARSETDVALAVASGAADAGLGLVAVARQYGLDVLPLATERYDLCIWRHAYFEPPLQALFAFACGNAFQARAAALEGYDVGETGRVRWNSP